MLYKNVCEARFISRPNRFVALVNLNGTVIPVHVKNTGRLSELLLPQNKVYLCESENSNRKTRYDLISVYTKDTGIVNIDSFAPNAVVKEWLQFKRFEAVTPEYGYRKSRLDFYFCKGEKRFLMEVKGCTLKKDGVGLFPDAPTKRGAKHLKELVNALSDGYESILAFVAQVPGMTEVRPNAQTDPEFAEAYFAAKSAGVKVLCMSCLVSEDEIKITGERFI